MTEAALPKTLMGLPVVYTDKPLAITETKLGEYVDRAPLDATVGEDGTIILTLAKGYELTPSGIVKWPDET